MAKSDPFFIRASIQPGAVYGQTSIELGAFVDALGKTVLRVHSIAVQYPDPDGGPAVPDAFAGLNWQLTTQSQDTMVDAVDKSVISTGNFSISTSSGGASYALWAQDQDVAPQMWDGGYLVGVEQIFLGTDLRGTAALFTGSAGNTDLSVVLECTVQSLTQNAAMALALSQQ